MLSLLQVTPGFEAAAAALFDGELAAPLLPEAQPDAMPGTGWVELTPLTAPSPPEGAQPLAGAIGAPSALARRLSHSFWVDNQDDGWRLQPRLQAGERLVDREGHLWRWDGFTRANAASGATAEHLRQHNRLAQLSGEIADAEADAARCRDAASVARAAREAATETERQAVFALRAAEEDLGRARAAEAELARRRMAAETRLAAVGETIDRLAGDAAEAASQREAAERALALQPDPALARTALAASRAQTTAARRRDSEARSVVDRLAAETAARHRRLAAISSEAASWRRRHDSAAAQHAALNERQAGLDGEIAELAARPAAIAGQSETLAVGAAAAAAEQRDAEDRLAAAETRLRLAAEAAHRGADAATAAREQRARLEARREAAVAALVPLRDEIAERFGQAIEAAAAPSAVGIDKIVAEDLGLRLERLRREREAMGPVNLLAEREAAEAEARRDELVRERSDLTEAIARLRRGIAALDREGRERVRAAFDALNRHFGELFERLFGGGRGELAWAGGDDPLVAGLDIRARPPGKRLETLSLLSGGEQALTAIALIFAVFLTNPAPICVLDEVDAPLDDANVDGFCRLVAEIADSTATRFLLITHHRVTMARMDRLFGVTMAERGVSQLVSVDLARAAELRQSA
jgi:chromosome segregation protein